VRVSAAIALAQIGFRSQRDDVDALLELCGLAFSHGAANEGADSATPPRVLGAPSRGRVELRGDADPACAEKAALLTPVPGGIGPITVALLLKNVVKLATAERGV